MSILLVEESVEHVNDFEELSCEICEKKFMSLTNLKGHDKRIHLKKGPNTEFKCDFCNNSFVHKRALYDHIQNIYKKCTLFARIFPTNKKRTIKTQD